MEVPVTLYQEVWNKMNFPIFHNHQHPASTASFISLFFILYYTEKKGSPQICFILWSLRSPNSWASHSCLLSSNWFFECEHQLLRETDGWNWAHWMRGKHGDGRAGEEIVRKRLAILCLVLFLYWKISMIPASISQLLSSLPLGQILSYLCPRFLFTENL